LTLFNFTFHKEHGVLGEYEYGPCSKSCEGGVRFKQKTCTAPASYGKCYLDCKDNEKVKETCNSFKCRLEGMILCASSILIEVILQRLIPGVV